ncbi:MAG: hypothetical protein ACJ76J_22525 [Thermoanaerobaculia bacterium]
MDLQRRGGGGVQITGYFELVGEVTQIEPIAAGAAIRQLSSLREQYGEGRWSKLKGIGMVRLPDGTIRKAELHWYEAHGIGRRRMKIKRFLD